MPNPTLQNRRYFKNYLKRFKDKFTSPIQTCQLSDIENIFSESSSGLTNQQIKVILFGGNNYDDPIDVSSEFGNGSLVYFPANAGDYVNLEIGSYKYQLYFNNDDGGITFNGNTYTLDDTFNVGTKTLTVKALGGALVETQDGPTYSIVPSTNSVSEGGSVIFTITTTGIVDGTTLYFNTSGPVSPSDFSDNSLSGSFIITNGTGSITRTISEDILVENEDFRLQILTDSINGSLVAESSIITLIDSLKTYSITESVTSLNEGDSITFTISTTDVADNTVLYYSINGTIGSSDFDDQTLTGSIIIASNAATITKSISEDFTVINSEGTENFVLELRTDSISGTIVATSSTISVSDTSTSSYTITESTTTVDEGSSVNFVVTTTGVTDGTSLYFTCSNASNVSPDSGNFVITNNTGTFSVTADEDIFIDTSSSFNVSVRTGSITGDIVSTSSDISIINTTSFSISVASTAIEGSQITFNITSTGVTDGSTLYYFISGALSTDVNPLSGSFVVTNNTSSVTVNTLQDFSNDIDIITFEIRTSPTGTAISTSSQVTINDLPYTLTITPSSTVVYESLINSSSTITFTITGTGIPDGSTLTYDYTGINSSDINPHAGSITFSGGSASFTATFIRDGSTEGNEIFYLNLRKNGIILLSSPEITLIDSSYLGSRDIGKTFGPIGVSRDGGNASLASDWYTICGLDSLPDGSKVALFIDNSGSMTTNTVRASYNLFLQKLAERNMDIIVVENGSENWVVSFNTILDD